MNRWKLLDTEKEECTPLIEDFIKSIEEAAGEGEPLELELSHTALNPYTLKELLEGLGYEKTEIDTNGWQADLWITMEKPGSRTLSIEATGIIFEMKLTETV